MNVNACALAAHEKAMWVKAHIAFFMPVARVRGVIHTVFEQVAGNVHTHHFAQNQPGGHFLFVQPYELNNLCAAALKRHRAVGKGE